MGVPSGAKGNPGEKEGVSADLPLQGGRFPKAVRKASSPGRPEWGKVDLYGGYRRLGSGKAGAGGNRRKRSGWTGGLPG